MGPSISFVWAVAATSVVTTCNSTTAAKGCAFVPTHSTSHVLPLLLSSNEDSFVEDDSESLSHWLSSPELYAGRLYLTIEEVKARKEKHSAASQALQERLSKLPASEGKLKHELVCEHRYHYGKHPFVCNQCWSYLPICLCPLPDYQPNKISLPPAIQQVILWTHHREWTSISNSGSLLSLLLKDTNLYMKGLPQHDFAFQSLLSRKDSTIVVLWPDNDTSSSSSNSNQLHRKSKSSRKTWQEVQEMITKQQGSTNITLLAMEGTWRSARRMASKLPTEVIRVALPSNAAYWRKSSPADGDGDNTKPPPSLSLLAQLRQQEGGSKDNLCTAEAVTAALVGLGMPENDGNRILGLIQKKVSLTRRYQGKQER